METSQQYLTQKNTLHPQIEDQVVIPTYRPHGPYWLFMASFTRIITVILFVYGFELILRFSRIFTITEHDGLLLRKNLPDAILGSHDDTTN